MDGRHASRISGSHPGILFCLLCLSVAGLSIHGTNANPKQETTTPEPAPSDSVAFSNPSRSFTKFTGVRFAPPPGETVLPLGDFTGIAKLYRRIGKPKLYRNESVVVADRALHLKAGDSLQTGPADRLFAAFRSSNTFFLSRQSRAKLQNSSRIPGRVRMDLNRARLAQGQGIFLVDTAKSKTGMLVKTPYAIVKSRHAAFAVRHSITDSTTVVHVYRGSVGLQPIESDVGEVQALASQKATVSGAKRTIFQDLLTHEELHEFDPVVESLQKVHVRREEKPKGMMDKPGMAFAALAGLAGLATYHYSGKARDLERQAGNCRTAADYHSINSEIDRNKARLDRAKGVTAFSAGVSVILLVFF